VELKRVVLSFGALTLRMARICPNAVFSSWWGQDGGGWPEKGVIKEGFYCSASASRVNAGRFIAISPPLMFSLPGLTFTGEEVNQTNQKPQIFGNCLWKLTESVSKHSERL